MQASMHRSLFGKVEMPLPTLCADGSGGCSR